MTKIKLLILFLIPCLVRAQSITLTLQGSVSNPKFKEVTIFSGQPTTRDTSEDLMYITGNNNSLLRFDLSELPSNAVITGAYLYLYGVTSTAESWKATPIDGVYDGSAGLYNEMVSLQKVLQPWSPSTINWNNQPSVADVYDPSTLFLPAPAGAWSNYRVPLTDFVQGWVASPSTNYGLELVLNYDNPKEINAWNLYSGQAVTDLQPRLVVTYQPVITPTCTESLILHGNLTSGKYRQVNYRNAPGVNDSSELQIEASTLDGSAQGYGDYTTRSILRYDVSSIPAGSTINTAKLYLYGKADNTFSPGFSSSGGNACFLEQIIRPWSPDTLEPNVTDPVVTVANRKILPENTDSWTPNYTLDLTDFVQHWVNAPDSNYGMRLRLQPYAENSTTFMFFNSAQAPDSLQPRLEICYTPGFNPSDSCIARFNDSIVATDRKTHLFFPITMNNDFKQPVQICWTFGDGADSCVQYDTSHPYSGAPMQHRYTDEYYSYPACIRVIYADSCHADYCAETKTASYCTAGFTDSVFLSNGLRHAFTPDVVNNQDKKPAYICWSFGDGNSSCMQFDSAHPYTGVPVIYTYGVTGDYRVSMTVQYEDSCSAAASAYAQSSFCDHTGSVTRFNTTDGHYQQAVISSATPTVADTSNTKIVAFGSYTNVYTYSSTALRFDVSFLPSNAVIMGATLYLSPNPTANNGYPVYSSYPAVMQHIKASWSPSTISWNHPPLTDTMAQASMTTASVSSKGYYLDMTRLVKYWKDKPDSNFGVFFSLSPSYATGAYYFLSATAADSVRPRLEICYYLADSACSASVTDSLLPTARATHCFRYTLANMHGQPPARICWSFGDGTDSCVYYDATHPYTYAPVYHTYPDMYQSYQVDMSVLYEDSCGASASLQTKHASKCSVATYDFLSGYGPSHEFIQWPVNDQYSAPTNICWSFGDGNDTCMVYDPAHPHATDTVWHSYAANGLFQPCVTVSYADGCTTSNCLYANYVNCDSNKLVIYGNRTSGKYTQTVKSYNYPYPSDTTQQDFIAFHAYLHSIGTEYTTRTIFRYDLSEIPDSAVVMDARLYLHRKDTVYSNYPDYSPIYSFQGRVEAVSQIASMSNFDSVINLTGIVQQWVSNPSANTGAVFHVYPEEPESGLEAIDYYSGSAPQALQPRLEVCYAFPYRPGSGARTMPAAATTAAVPTQAELYPNPASDELNIRVQSGQSQSGAIYLYDLQGRMIQVLQQRVQYSKGINSLHVKLDRSHIVPGLYLVKIQAGAGSYTYKVILK